MRRMPLGMLLLLAVLAGGRAAGSLWMRRTQPRAPDPDPQHQEEAVRSGLFAQRLDHLDPDDSRTWNQSYRWSNASYRPGGPAFVMLAGTSEADYLGDWLRSGHMADLARQLHAERFLFSMRFYSQPYPTVDARAASLEYLSTEQVLLDVRALLLHLREGRPEQPVVLFGGGYAGAVATWARQRFPELVLAAIVSGAVVEPRIQLALYFPVVTHAVNVLHQKDLQCKDSLEEAFVGLDSLLDSAEGRQEFNKLFNPCTPLAVDKVVPRLDRAQLLGVVASFIADLVQENVDSEDGDELEVPCKTLKYLTTGETAVSALASILTASERGKCLEFSFDALVRKISNESWESPPNKMGIRPWLWQQCTEMGLFATSSASSFPYSSRITLNFHKTLCSRAFGGRYDYSELINNMREVLRYGGKTPNVTNVIFVKGELDPWKESSPADEYSSPLHPVFTVRRASHAHDMFKRDPFDPPRIKSVRKQVAAILRTWLH